MKVRPLRVNTGYLTRIRVTSLNTTLKSKKVFIVTKTSNVLQTDVFYIFIVRLTENTSLKHHSNRIDSDWLRLLSANPTLRTRGEGGGGGEGGKKYRHVPRDRENAVRIMGLNC